MKHKKFFGAVLACILLLSAVAAGINSEAPKAAEAPAAPEKSPEDLVSQ